MESCYYAVNGIKMHVRVSEETLRLLDPQTLQIEQDKLQDNLIEGRPIVVLVHGLVVASTYMEGLAKELAAWFPVFVPELPGFETYFILPLIF